MNPPYPGGCACGTVRFAMLCAPMFVHCCHCTRCQRETGGPFAHHAMIEFSRFELQQGAIEWISVSTDSGRRHWVARCPTCRTALWNEHGSRKALTRYLRVGTLDEPALWPPQAHIFVRSRQPWVVLSGSVHSFEAHYDARKLWPAESLARYEAARQLKASRA